MMHLIFTNLFIGALYTCFFIVSLASIVALTLKFFELIEFYITGGPQ
jgi:hypothetical protein